MAHEADELARRLEQFREYLALMARLNLDVRLQGKIDLSGVVQQTMLEAHRVMHGKPQRSDEDLAPWLRRILANNLKDEIRKLHTQARDATREQSLEQAIEASSARLAGLCAAHQSSPSQRAMRNEESQRLAAALARIPVDQRRAIELHHLKGLSLQEIAVEMDRRKGAVAALLFRGLNTLRELLKDDGEGTS